MNAQLRSELLKQRSTRTNLWLLLSMVGLIAAVVLLHVVSLPAQDLGGREGQLKVFGLGTTFGMIFASLLGAMSVTNEIRHGLIRPTFLATPKRAVVIAAKVAASVIAGAAFGLIAEALAVGVGSAGLVARGIVVAPTGGDFTQLLAGGAGAAALWAAIGVGVGAIVRNQVGAIIAAIAFFFVLSPLPELLPGSIGDYFPAQAVGSLHGLEETEHGLSQVAGGLVLAAWSLGLVAIGTLLICRRDVAD
jgi:ABC-2 type transport system permease protein